MPMKVRNATMRDAQEVLLRAWGVLFVLAVLWVVFAMDLDQLALTWLLPATVPILGALIAARIKVAREGAVKAKEPVDEVLYHLALGLSLLYAIILGFVLSNVLLIVDRMKGAGILLGPLEGILVLLFGYIFFFDPKNPPGVINPAGQDEDGG